MTATQGTSPAPIASSAATTLWSVWRSPGFAWALAAWSLAALLAGLAAWLFFRSGLETAIWATGIVPVLLALIFQIAESLRRREIGLDVVALLSMGGALLLGETLAGNVVALMYSGGQLLETFAAGRARREMTALLARTPKSAMRYGPSGLEEAAVATLAPGDRILVRNGDTLPVDGTVASATALLDQSALTGESLPVRHAGGTLVLSGSVNAGDAFDLVATRTAAESAYAGIVRLVEEAGRAKAPMVRLADRYAVWFLLVTVFIAGGAWLATGDPVRALAVLVVATPCPLILAVPVAIVSGVSLTARHGLLVKGGGVLEGLSRVRTMVIDKTGTLTAGRASLISTHPQNGFSTDDVLLFAASLDQASNHSIAEALTAAARQRNLPLASPQAVAETPGSGLEGLVEGRRVVIGGPGFVRARLGITDEFAPDGGDGDGVISVAVAVDGNAAGTLLLSDEIRPEAPAVLAALRKRGVDRIVLASGDRADVTASVGARLGVDAVMSELTPEDKVALVLSEREHGPVMMVGDGVNDSPALAAADIGVAMGARGAAPSSEAADAVLLVDRLDRLIDGMDIARRSRRIALQSVYVGIGLSVAAMPVAAFGYLPPVAGALLQEAIDVAVILNALRALRDPAAAKLRHPAGTKPAASGS
jgi:heavy metal translocating P-type ATPase